MNKKIIADVNPQARMVTELIDERHLEHVPKNGLRGIVKKVRQDVRPILKYVEAIREEKPSEEFRHFATVPYFIYQEWLIKMKREGLSTIPDSWIREWANDPDNAAFRTWPGRI